MDLTSRPLEDYIGDRDLTRWRSPLGRWLAPRVVALLQMTTSTMVMIVTAVIGGGVAVGLASVFGEIYEAVTEGDGIAGLDQPLLTWMVAHRSPGFDSVVTVFTTSGGPVWMPVVTSVAVGLVAWRLRSWAPVILMLIAVAGSLLMTVVGKAAIGRERPALADAVPPYESSSSFPSGHTLNSVVITAVIVYFLLITLSSLAARVVTVALGTTYALGMGLSRVYLGHHWLSDVLAAWALGLCWVGFLITAHRLALTHAKYVSQVREGATTAAQEPDAEEGITRN
ncbi:MAG TPA: phosphatase PAP2 family protein [Propionibacteriaceae bacterium]|nr:phosphatase PAP2 family protein [Propionibacteriaceae bacterium]